MIDVLIVDDEPKLREGLRAFIDWEALGYRVADTAANGNEALEKYAICRPGLVIADIRMPGMDGLQLIQRLREQDPLLHILILSGYADFDYAKKAIAHRADGYLLKPVDEDELIEYLRGIKAAIEEERASEEWQHATKEWTREALIHMLLTDTEHTSDDRRQLKDRAEELGLIWNCYQVLLVALHDELTESVLYLLRRAMAETFEQDDRGLVFELYGQVGVLLKEPLLAIEREGIYRSIRNAIGETGVEFTVALGSKAGSLNEIAGSYSAARELIKLHFFLDDGKLLCQDDAHSEYEEGCSEVLPSETLTDQIYYAVDIGNMKAVKSLVRQTGRSLVAEGYSETDIKRRFVEILTSVMGKGLQQHPELQQHNKPFSDMLAEIYHLRSIQALYDKIDYFFQQLMSNLGEKAKHREVKIMLDLIERNFSDNLKLETLSGVLNYNSAYLGKLFKNETGEYFNTYLDKVRIEKAKSYLEAGFKVYQVAEKVGYTNVDYFHSKFKKYVGTSPSAYRRHASSE
ncbi:response regulator transcription factor [Paenibacillus woosongensis]|uniref:Response regulator transcription factor n=1 Tax=Paenibacillus woosongensis TaxID=307580 RepID=A0AA95L121_9BACL|nr:response regulator transcription factor [Paenibacillus woosongensis]WHX47831.1 response regulator transcription factor [Paenibacillus woosongensis]